MFLLGHLGIGSRLGAAALGKAGARAWGWVWLGTLLPDLIDKPLYYGLASATGKRAAALGLISSTRTVGHTALLGALLWLLLAARGRGAAGRALFTGFATHWLLDLLGDAFGGLLLALGLGEAQPAPPGPPTLAAVLFPLLGPRFPVMPWGSLGEHLLSLGSATTLAGEALGGALLLSAWRARRAAGAALPPDP